MTQEEAMQIIRQACASVVGNLEVHSKIQEAVKVIEEEIYTSLQLKREDEGS